MAPFLAAVARRVSAMSTTAGELRHQWTQPGDVFSVLLILGGDVVARALAQVAGSRSSTVAFSFGMSART